MPVIKYRVDKNSPWNSIVAIKGEPGEPGKDGTVAFEELTQEQRESLKGPQGDKGETYVLTEADKTEIANLVLANFPSGEEVSY